LTCARACAPAAPPPSLFETDEQPRRVHFRVVDATEGEHGNVKASEATKRFFIIHAAKPVEVSESGELVINFEYRPDPEKSGQENSWRDKRNGEAVTTILSRLTTMAQGDAVLTEYLQLLQTPAPTESDKKRVLLAKYINQYTARNTMDYFIHKDLGAFLRRELDFYIKNEVMRLDDIENAEAPAVETYLAKIKVLRRIAGQLIDFLAQLEDFQKKLWLKKKFVVETNYCITLDRVPEELYPEIAANAAQREEWVKLFAIDEIAESTVSPGYTVPLTVEFLKANDKLVLDTRFFDEAFKARLLAAIENLDEQCDGLLIHSENFQALNLLQERYREQVKSEYIDPPYNTSASEIIYKNGYKSSSWLSYLDNRLRLGRVLLSKDGMKCVTIDDFEFHKLREVLSALFGEDNIAGVVAIKNNPSGRSTVKGFSIAHEYGIFVFSSEHAKIGMLPRTEEQLAQYGESDDGGQYQWRNFMRAGGANDIRSARPKLHYPLLVSRNGVVSIPDLEWDEQRRAWRIISPVTDNYEIVYPISNGVEYTWRLGIDTLLNRFSDLRVRDSKQGRQIIEIKFYIDEEGVLPKTIWDDKTFNATAYGTTLLRNLMGTSQAFSFPKSVYAVQQSLRVLGANEINVSILDYFAGSGTTGHAVINLNREDEGKRRYILVEMGDYFDAVLKPRIAKVVYSETWKDGKPTARDTGISHCFKYLRLESYEDALNNLTFDEDTVRSQALAANAQLREDYMLHYLLDVETRGSQSLLNIDAFADPTAYTLEVKQPGTDEYVTRTVDIIETFNYLIGLRVTHIAAPQTFTASFTRKPDPELPEDQHTRLVVDGRIRQAAEGAWWFRKVEGWVPRDPANPNNGQREKVLIVWRKLTGDLEQDNLMLDEWFQKNRISTRDFEFDTIYVNGSNNLPNLLQEGDTWKVRLIEETFMQRMWDVEGV
jgi:adenine-specific DNA-methyltransferase